MSKKNYIPGTGDPIIGGGRTNTPFTGELNALLQEIRDVDPQTIRGFEDYELIEDFYNRIGEIGITTQESINFFYFIDYLYSYNGDDPKVVNTRAGLLSFALTEFHVFFRDRNARERISGILVKLLSTNNEAFYEAFVTINETGGTNYPEGGWHEKGISNIYPPLSEEANQVFVWAYVQGLLYEAANLRGLV